MRITIATLFLCLLFLAPQRAMGSQQTCIEVQGPTISPDGQSVVFNVNQRKPSKHLVSGGVILLDLRTRSTRTLLRAKRRESKRAFGEVVELPVPYAEAWYGFSWSPHGEAVFVSVVEGLRKGFSIWKLPVHKGRAKRICRLRLGLCQRPRVSPDWNWVLFRDAVREDLFRVRPDGKGCTRLTSVGDVFPLGYDWAPDGGSIYFFRGHLAHMREEAEPGLWEMNPDGTGKVVVLDNYSGRNLALSPSGKYIAFNHITDALEHDLFIYRPGGQKPRLVAEEADLFFSWHPRVDVLLYADQKGLCEWRAPTGSSRRLVSAEMTYFPVATPDGKTVLFLKKEGKDTLLWRLDVASGKTERLFPPE